MKTALITTFIIFGALAACAQPYLDWAFGIGGEEFEYPANSMATDQDGNVYIAGYFFGEVDFDPSVQTADDYDDSFFAKYDPDGNLIYVKHIIGENYVRVHAITVDAEGNVYLTGTFGGLVDFNPHSSATANVDAEGFGNSFIAKYATDGDYLFAKQIGGDSGVIESSAIALDAEDNIYIAGGFKGSPNFQTQPGEELIITSESAAGADKNAFVAKYDSYGNYQAAQNVARGEGDSSVNAIIIDHEGDVIVTGRFKGTTTFNQAIFASEVASEGNYDAFIAKYDLNFSASFSFRYAERIGGIGVDRGNDLALDADNNVYVIGTFNTELIESDGASIAPSLGGSDFFYFSYDPDGNRMLERTFGGTGNDEGRGILVDSEGMIYLAGEFSGSVDFNTLPFPTQVDMYTSAGGTDVFLAKYNSSGFYIEGHYGGSINYDELNGIAADANGNVFISGIHQGTAEFGTDESVLVPYIGYRDIFLAKYAFEFATSDIAENAAIQAALYPNPTSGNITLSLSGQHTYHQATLLDISGRAIQSSSITQGTFIKELYTDNLADGVYFIQLKGYQEQHTLKFIKQ